MADVEAFTRVRVNASSFIRIGEKLFIDEHSLAADSSFFDLFTYSFLQGDPETALVRPYTVVLTRSTARRYFGNENPVGRTINVENAYDLEVTAVLTESLVKRQRDNSVWFREKWSASGSSFLMKLSRGDSSSG